MGSIGFPIKLLHEAEGHIVTGDFLPVHSIDPRVLQTHSQAVELRNGEMYRGRLVEAEDNMSCQLSGIVLTGKDGKVTSLEQVCVSRFLSPPSNPSPTQPPLLIFDFYAFLATCGEATFAS
jgi:small nuclear ribonucleoprotein D3